ncbi:probable metabolite transport protein CsbC [Diorhabda carinulata]|uniref:probable metabolite transport protein CsbC n=1 Tax=Diorhabda carinulata TaxID=1163345 RepID=UPI0025A0A924|nr:probable metabolite transport protein CsbC [Diorhabda carinulata]
MEVEVENIPFHNFEKIKNRFPWYMYFCVFSAHLLITACGMSTTWFLPVIPVLQSNDTHINPLETPVTTLQLSMLVSIPIAAGAVSFVFWSKIMDKFGRKTTMDLLSIVALISLFVISFAKNIYTLIIFLSLHRICMSGSMISVLVYTTEISCDATRGRMGCLMSIQVPFGILIGYILGSVTSVRYFTLICGVPFILYLVLSPLLSESPRYLISKQKNFEVMKVLKKLRGNIAYMEYENMRTLLPATTPTKPTFLSIIRDNCSRKSFFLGSEIITFEQFSGISVIITYVGVIFDNANIGLKGNEVAIIIGVTKILSYILSLYLVDRIGRRPLMLFSIFMCMFSLFILGVYFHQVHIGSQLFDNIRWLPILFIIIYIIVYSVGLGVVPMAFTGEIFPDHLRAVGVGYVLIITVLVSAIVSFIFPIIKDFYGLHWCFWLFCIASLAGFIRIYLTMPETKNKTFLEIQNMLKRI